MIPTLEPHQQLIVDLDPKQFLLGWGGGSGKTATALHLARGKTLVICPKQQRDDRTWFRDKELFKLDIDLTVISKDDLRIRGHTLEKYDTVIADECHTLFGVTTDTRILKGVRYPKTSQTFQAFYDYLTKYKPERLYLVSGTPADKPMKTFAIGVLMGRWGMNRYFEFRDKYYFCKRIGYREMWIPRKSEELELKLASLIKSFGVTGQLEDWYKVPPQIHETIYVNLTTDQTQALSELVRTEADPMVVRTKQRAIENGVSYDYETIHLNEKESRFKKVSKHYSNEKIQAIKRIVKERGKTIIFACYTAQIEAIEKALKEEGHLVLTLTGATKSEDRKTIMQTAETAPHCVVIAQSSISAGWEVKSCRTMIFASLSYRAVDLKQSVWRILRLSNLSECYNHFYFIIVKGGMDESCYKCVKNGYDFIEKVLAN